MSETGAAMLRELEPRRPRREVDAKNVVSSHDAMTLPPVWGGLGGQIAATSSLGTLHDFARTNAESAERCEFVIELLPSDDAADVLAARRAIAAMHAAGEKPIPWETVKMNLGL